MKENKNVLSERKKYKFKMPDTMVLLIVFVFIVGICTYIIPAGTYEKIIDAATKAEMVDPNSYHRIESTPVNLYKMLAAIPQGLNEAAYITTLMFIIGGAFQVIKGTGAIDAALGVIVKKLPGRKSIIVVPALSIFASLLGHFMGSQEALLAFVPLSVSACIALGFDSIVGYALIMAGGIAGYASSSMSMYSTAVAQDIAGVPIFSGMALRLVAYVIFIAATIAYISVYALRIRKDSSKSPMTAIDKELNTSNSGDIPEFNTRRKLVLAVFALGIFTLVFGIIKLGFKINDVGTVFLISGIVGGYIGGLKTDKVIAEFTVGAKSMIYAALIVGISRAVSIELAAGGIIDTIIHAAASVISGASPCISAVSMFFLQVLINFVIPSSSGQAAVTMPIMAPLGDILGISRQTSVLAYQFGDSFTNLLFPTVGFVMAGLAMVHIPWQKWAKWLLPLIAIWSVISVGVLVYAVNINWA